MTATCSGIIAESVVLENSGLYAFPLPLALPPVGIMQAWHPLYESDPVHQWLGQTVARITQARIARDRSPRQGADESPTPSLPQ
jgi:hypothetical protein